MKSSFPEATVITREELYVGLSARLGREIMKEDIYTFARTSATLIRCMSAPTTQSSYSLGKATQEYTVRLLVPELARKEITVNVVSPSHIATGINKQTGDKHK